MVKLLVGIFVLVVVAMTMTVSSNTAQAHNTFACDTEIHALIAAVSGSTSLSGPDQAGLTRKADGAHDKLEAEKFENADQKLMDFETKFDKLAATIGTKKEKISAADEASLRAALVAAKTCVGGLL